MTDITREVEERLCSQISDLRYKLDEAEAELATLRARQPAVEALVEAAKDARRLIQDLNHDIQQRGPCLATAALAIDTSVKLDAALAAFAPCTMRR